MSSLTLVEITRSKDGADAFNALSLDVTDNETFTITGPFGNGQESLLRCIAGQERLDSGEIFLAGAPVSTLSARARDIVLISGRAYSRSIRRVETVLCRNATKNRRKGKPSKEARAAAVATIMDILAIQPYRAARLRDVPPLVQQLTSIGAAVLSGPECLLLDDPFQALDPHGQYQARQAMARLRAASSQFPATIVLATRHPLEALALGQHVAVMDGGRIVDCTSAETLYRHPRHVRAATWLGIPGMNCVAARRRGDRQLELSPSCTLTLPYERIQHLPGSQKDYFVAFRPEHVELLAQDDPIRNGPRYQLERLAWDSTLHGLEPWGLGALATLQLDNTPIFAKPPNRPPFAVGQPVHASVLASRCHIFHGVDGRLISTGNDA